MNRFGLAAALCCFLLAPGCVTSNEKTVDVLMAEYKERRAQRLAELEPLYGKCVMDGWRSHSVIGKTTSKELIRHMRACDHTEWHVSNHVSANRTHTFVHLGTDRMWHFINGVLVSYRQ